MSYVRLITLSATKLLFKMMKSSMNLFWSYQNHHFSTTKFTTKEWFYPKNDIGINYPELISDFCKGSNFSLRPPK